MISIITRRRKVFSFGISTKVLSLSLLLLLSFSVFNVKKKKIQFSLSCGFRRLCRYGFCCACEFYSVNSDDASKWILSFVMQTANGRAHTHTKCIRKHCCVVIYFSENNCPNYRNERYNSVKYFQPIDLFYFICYNSLHSHSRFLSFSRSPSLLRFTFISSKIIIVASSHSNSPFLALSLLLAPLFKMWKFLIGKVNSDSAISNARLNWKITWTKSVSFIGLLRYRNENKRKEKKRKETK